MTRLFATIAALAASGPVCAQTITVKPLIDTRLRAEAADIQGLSGESEAVTIRVRAGASAARGPFVALVEGQGNLALTGNHHDGLHGSATRPVIADPENVALYRAQIQYRSKQLTVTAGRQRIILGDERFVGAVDFRQNGQTFDALRTEWDLTSKVKADISYVWGVRTIWGSDGEGARQRSISGDTVMVNLAYASPVGTLTGFAYLIDQDEAAVQNYRLSSQTFGARVAGTRALGKGVALSYQASWARQSDYGRNPNRYRAQYHLIEAGLAAAGFKASGGYEVLGADGGAAFSSFQTPLATGFKFQGWADKFLSTPPDGVRDFYGSVGYGAKAVGPLTSVSLQAVYHRFHSDRRTRHYGDEIDLIASGKLGKYTLSLRYAKYDAAEFGDDTRRAWLQADWAF